MLFRVQRNHSLRKAVAAEAAALPMLFFEGLRPGIYNIFGEI